MDTQQVKAARLPPDVPVEVEEAEAALVDNYPQLVRLAYITLPSALGRHRRVLAAHHLVQRALPRSRRSPGPVTTDSAGSRGGGPDPAYALVRQEVLRAAMAYGQRTGWRRKLQTVSAWVRLPQVWGLRLHPKAGATDELALDRTLAVLGAEARAAFALSGLEGLSESGLRNVLAAAGVADPRRAVNAQASAGNSAALLGPGDFDPCTVQARPTDLLRRRQRGRTALTGLAALVVAGLLLPISGGIDPYQAEGSPAVHSGLLEPAALVRVNDGAWAATSRVDFTAWPARGGRSGDTALLRRALAVWGRPGARVRVTTTPGTSATPPPQPPQLLYAGDVDGATVVLLHDGMRIVRYAEPRDGRGASALDFARVDDAGIDGAAAVVVGRTDGNTRFLTAPWIDNAQTRDLLTPDRQAQPLRRSADGVTDPVRMPGADAPPGSCGASWPALQLRSSSRIPDQPSFLLSDLGDLTPVDLTYAPPSGQPQAATGAQALASWAHSVCHLGALRGQGVKAANNWEFATQKLPEDGGTADWVCTRTDTWRGPGRALVQFIPSSLPDIAPGTEAAAAENTAACGTYGQRVLADVLWKARTGHWYLLAAGNREVTRIEASGGGVHATSDGPLLSTRTDRDAHPTVTARLSTGERLTPLG